MQLILVDTGDNKVQVTEKRVAFNRRKVMGHCVHVQLNQPSEESNDDEKVANCIISEITGGESSLLRILCYPCSDSDGKYKTVLRCVKNKKGVNWLKSLHDRFGEMVVISAELNFSCPYDEDQDQDPPSISVKGLLVLQELGEVSQASLPYFCGCNMDLISTSSLAQVKLVAHISNELIQPNLHLLKDTNKKILEEGVASDVVIEAENGAEIGSHKCFLISTSSVFQRMFQSEMEESKSGRIDMTDISEEGIRAFLKFIYHGEVIELKENLDLAFTLLYAAHKYDVAKLEASMILYLVGRKDEEISLGLAFKIYSLVRGMKSASELKAKVVCIMSMKYNELKELPEFKEVFQKNPADAIEICSNLVNVRPLPSRKRKIDDDNDSD